MDDARDARRALAVASRRSLLWGGLTIAADVLLAARAAAGHCWRAARITGAIAVLTACCTARQLWRLRRLDSQLAARMRQLSALREALARAGDDMEG
jgi:hypothetical protein